MRRRAKVYIFFMLCCHCVDLCHDRCACLAGQNALIKKVSFWSARGRGWYGVVLSGSPPPFILSLSLSPVLSIFCSVFADSPLEQHYIQIKSKKERYMRAAKPESTVRYQPQGTSFELYPFSKPDSDCHIANFESYTSHI